MIEALSVSPPTGRSLSILAEENCLSGLLRSKSRSHIRGLRIWLTWPAKIVSALTAGGANGMLGCSTAINKKMYPSPLGSSIFLESNEDSVRPNLSASNAGEARAEQRRGMLQQC